MLKKDWQKQGGAEPANDADAPRVILISPTYRDPNGDPTAFRARYEGMVSLYRQFLAQDYPADRLELRICDLSADAHPFFEQLDDPRVKYFHIPDRSEETKAALAKDHPGAAAFLLTDEDLLSHHYRSRIGALQEFCSKRVDPVSAKLIPSIRDPLEMPRPAIGMMRNILCALPFGAKEDNLKPDVVIAMDDDDWRADSYVKNTVERLQDADWTKLVSYHLAIHRPGQPMIWGEKKFTAVDDGTDLPQINFSDRAMMYNVNAGVQETSPETAFRSPRWHPLSTDGTVHALRYDAWERTVDLCDGYAPVSYNEDTLMFESLRLLGNLHRKEEVARHPLLLRGLINEKFFTDGEIAADRARGAMRFNPEFDNKGDFARLCCANVSPVAFSGLVHEDEIPADMRHAFDFLLDDPASNTYKTSGPGAQPG